MKYLISLIIVLLIQGCATGPTSKANDIYRDYGGVVKKHVDYDKDYFEDWETATLVKKGKIKRHGKRIGQTMDDHHAIFGHFERRENEFENGSVAKIAYLELLKLLEDTVKSTAKDLGFELINPVNKKMSFSLTHVLAYQAINKKAGCAEVDECVILIKSTVAHIGTGTPGYKGRMSGGSNTKHRVIGAMEGTFIHFTAHENSIFDQRRHNLSILDFHYRLFMFQNSLNPYRPSPQ